MWEVYGKHCFTILRGPSTVPSSLYHELPLFLINVRDPLYFLGYGIPCIYVKGLLSLPRVMWAKFIEQVT